MASLLNKSLAAALLCGAIGLAGTALAQVGAAGSESKGAASATGATHTGPGQIDSSAGSNTSSYGASGKATASADTSAEKPGFLNDVQSKSTKARGLKGAAMKRVDANERKITAELNRASAQSTGNANASSQASVNTRSDQNIQ